MSSNSPAATVADLSKGRFKRYDLYDTILLYYYAKTKDIIYNSLNFEKEVV